MNGDGFAPSLVMVSCSIEESKGSEMLDIQSLAVLGEQGGSYLVTSDWVVKRVKNFCQVVRMSRRFLGSSDGIFHCN